ncbi:FAD-dependent oxidoreductase [Propionicimonas sp.]|uniref:FAD-dependent oxidoreductase n=1 Tax=Propionicimonas sp. TaxID=1955623 RepID=UPI00180A439F|nr:FAD-dependent oxidoreductase [Propionicimonas sp.]MBU3976425.1 FAD-dependent monooxygenase [Actinomycetota bacterium]MBA3020265.1 FAD-dependent oxidoreductase [Propionicimonas sp.]MBU3986052.1 FAD-dependent monooxygenase [Actinomycetota bacterium]MBU4007569.1 FAD-dependent monooxygenase [Actinomycetota bacterium]MBU4064350.1 FAD-dependent monooxygenase [Actinomycetota bacterium]
MDIIIVGAGIGGLTAAIALAKDGHQVRLVERSPEFTAAGAGIVLAPNAVQVLASLGVTLAGEGQVLASTEITDKAGRRLANLSPARLAAAHGPSYGITRARVHELLAAALPAGVEVVFDSTIRSVEDDGSRVQLSSSTGGLSAEVVVAADGLRSAVRAQLPTGPGALRYSGTTCWRGLIDFEAGQVATEAWGGHTRVGVVPVGGGRAYYYLVATAEPEASGPGELAGFTELFGGYGGVAGELLAELRQVPPLHHDLFELDRPVWGAGRVLLLGDAAHSMTPNQGQGAVMAIEDAKALMLAIRGGAEGALARYTAARHARVRKVQLDSRRLGEVAHWGNPVAVAVRNFGMRLTPQSAGDATLAGLVRPGIELAVAK